MWPIQAKVLSLDTVKLHVLIPLIILINYFWPTYQGWRIGRATNSSVLYHERSQRLNSLKYLG